MSRWGPTEAVVEDVEAGDGVVCSAGRCRDRVAVVDAGGSRASLSAADLRSAMPGLRHQEGSCWSFMFCGRRVVSSSRWQCRVVVSQECWAAGDVRWCGR